MGWLLAVWTLIKAGVGETVGEKLAGWFFRLFKNRRKKPRRMEDKVTIGILQQKVRDLTKEFALFKRETTTDLRATKRRLESCQAERTECRADLSNLTARVMTLEKKTGIRTA